jgi:hypothetical protein
MAKTDMTLKLKTAVVLGNGDKAKTHTSGSIVRVSEELATQLIEARAAVVYDEPRVADPDAVPIDPASLA